MTISIRGATEHNLRAIDVDIGPGLTVVTGVSGSGKTSLVFDTLYHEARRRLLGVYSLGSSAQRLSPAAVASIEGIGPAVAVGQNLLNRNPNSTLATASGLHPFLRLFYARFGERACSQCGTNLRVMTDDEIVSRLSATSDQEPVSIYAPLVRNARGSHRTLLQLLAQEFGVNAILADRRSLSEISSKDPHQVSLEPSRAHDIDVLLGSFDTNLTAGAARGMVDMARSLGAQTISIRGVKGTQTMSWTPACTNCGAWFSDLEPLHFHSRCPHCDGEGCPACHDTGLLPEAASVRWSGRRITELLSQSVLDVNKIFSNYDFPESAARLRREITTRLVALTTVGLGYLSLDRSSPTLSRGEAQRVRLAVILTSQLEDMLHVLDEPTIGQHPADISNLLQAMRSLKGPVVYVEHDRAAAAAADEVIDLGPGAGALGGRLVFQGSPSGLWQADSATGRYFSLRDRVPVPKLRPPPEDSLLIRGANKHNLRTIDVTIPLGRLSVVTGVSGSGKSTLVEGVIAASLSADDPIGCRSVGGPPLQAVVVDQKPIGRNPRSNPATYTKLSDVIRDYFAVMSDLSPSHFSFNRKEGACPVCKGMGAVEVKMRYLPSTWIPCSACGGRRFSDEICSIVIPFGERSFSIDQIYALSIAEVRELFESGDGLSTTVRSKAMRILTALGDLGLDYLPLGQASPTLSGGEAQRVKLAKYLGRSSLNRQFLILDEPTTGLHPQDISGLLIILDRLVRAGATVVMVEHTLDAIQAADWVVDLGPGAGPAGGRLLYEGPVNGLMEIEGSATGKALFAEEQHELSPKTSSITRPVSEVITIKGARANNLRSVDINIPKGSITVVTGVSGSGKSSLVNDVLEAEARRRYLESLSLYERQGIKEGPEAALDELTGLGVTLSVGTERRLLDLRSTVGTATEIAHHLAIILTWYGRCTCLECGEEMSQQQVQGARAVWVCNNGHKSIWAEPRFFSPLTYAAACQHCSGVGTLQSPNPGKLILHPDRPLCGGAMHSPGFFPKGYLCKPFNGGYDMVQALAIRYGFDPDLTPWNEMTHKAQHAFLYGDPEPMEVQFETRNRRYTRTQSYPGFYGFIRDWDTGGTYTDSVICPRCAGARLREQYLAISVYGNNIHQLSQLSLVELHNLVEGDLASSINRHPSSDGWQLPTGSQKTITRRLKFLIRVGLGYLHLNQPTSTLSAGEAQRINLAGLMGSGLSSLTVLLDEPTRGMHPREVDALFEALSDMRDDGNTVIMVEHEEKFIRSADFVIDLGPGAGSNGGEIVASGTPQEVALENTTTARWLRGDRIFNLDKTRRRPRNWMTIENPRANNLMGEDVRLPLDVITGVCGVSGSGKSTLIIDIVGRALAPKKHTTSVASEQLEPGQHRAIENAPSKTMVVDQTRAGLVSPASFLGLDRPIRALFASGDDAAALGLSEKDLRRGCTACNGRGSVRLDMGFLPAVYSSCEICRGSGYLPEAWEVRERGFSLPQIDAMTIDELFHLFEDIESLRVPLSAARSVGVGYLVLRQPGRTLSGGEAQRLKIAKELKKRSSSPTLYMLDEPTVGQHLEDVLRLRDVFHQLRDAGHGVIIIEHHPHLLASCDWLVELGPGGGPDGGRIVATGSPDEIAAGNSPISPYLREVMDDGQAHARI